MKSISILVPQGHTSLPNIDGTHQIFTEVNRFCLSMGKQPLFDVKLVGISREVVQRNGRFTIVPDCLIDDVKKTNLVIIPAMHGDMAAAIADNQRFTPWILEQYKNGAEIASLCIGSFFLASTGLLKGKRCATHWSAAKEFQAMFPDVIVVDDKIITEDDGIYSSGGAYSFLNLIVYFIEKFAGRDMAILVSKAFMIDIDRYSQSPFIIFSGQKEHDDEPIKKAQEIIEANFQDRITVDELAAQLCLGRRNLERRFKKATSNTVVEYMQRVKIEAAKKNLETGRKTVNEIMYDVGYSDTKAFRTVFKKVTGLSPLDYRNKYNREAIAV